MVKLNNANTNPHIHQRKSNALELKSEAIDFLNTGSLPSKLAARIQALKAQETTLNTKDAIEILLDYADREIQNCECLEKKSQSSGLLRSILNLLSSEKRK